MNKVNRELPATPDIFFDVIENLVFSHVEQVYVCILQTHKITFLELKSQRNGS